MTVGAVLTVAIPLGIVLAIFPYAITMLRRRGRRT
jgi:hypothetical protein